MDVLDALVLKRGLFGHEQVPVPIDWVEGIDEDGLVLRVAAAEVEGSGGQAKEVKRTDPAG